MLQTYKGDFSFSQFSIMSLEVFVFSNIKTLLVAAGMEATSRLQSSYIWCQERCVVKSTHGTHSYWTHLNRKPPALNWKFLALLWASQF